MHTIRGGSSSAKRVAWIRITWATPNRGFRVEGKTVRMKEKWTIRKAGRPRAERGFRGSDFSTKKMFARVIGTLVKKRAVSIRR